jgi:hypothetical protein
MKLEDKWWLAANKQANRAWMTYLGIIAGWVIVGVFCSAGGLALGKALEDGIIPVYLPVLLILCAVVLAILSYRIDKKYGYIEAIQKHYAWRRTAKANRLNIKLDSNLNIIKEK